MLWLIAMVQTSHNLTHTTYTHGKHAHNFFTIYVQSYTSVCVVEMCNNLSLNTHILYNAAKQSSYGVHKLEDY